MVDVSRKPASLVDADAILGVVLEVGDLAAARSFYEPIFRDVAGEWEQTAEGLVFRCGQQWVELVPRAEPRTLGETGQHQAYRVRASRLQAVVDELRAVGHGVDWWREDHPSERLPTAYLHDPSGNRVQLVPSEDLGQLLDHAAVEMHDLEPAEVFSVKVLGGGIDYYHGRSVDHYLEARAWGEGRDPCAPWTRLWPGGGLSTDPRHRSREPHPNQQIFVRFGGGLLGLILAREHRQEPPEDQVRGTPRLVLRSPLSPAAVVASLTKPTVSLEPEDRLDLRFELEGSSVFLRDPGGNFVEVRYAG